MLERLGKPPGPDDELIAGLFRRHIEKFAAWVKEQPDFRVLDTGGSNEIVGTAFLSWPGGRNPPGGGTRHRGDSLPRQPNVSSQPLDMRA